MEAFLNNEKEQVFSFIGNVYDLNNSKKKILVDKLYKFLRSDRVKDKIVDVINVYNVKHVGFLIDNQLFEYDTHGYHRNTYTQNGEDGWNWKYLGEEYHGVTDKSPDEVHQFIERLTNISKDSNQTRDVLCFDKICNNYHLFCHNCQDFASLCMEFVGYANSKVFETFTIKNKDILFVKPLNHVTKPVLMENIGINIPYDKINQIIDDCNNVIKKMKKFMDNTFDVFEKSIYNIKCYNTPLMYAFQKVEKSYIKPNQCNTDKKNILKESL